ncbi:MAG: peptidase C69 [Deltaproteobacteria bacterium RBG_13_47_9]|nr:MAG: peptidase C69 [Deltaproteobacteria bacterium RBG_13_47_9]
MNIDLPVQKILGEALKEGGEFADLFFEQNDSVLIICEADRIEKVISGQDIGVGLRVLFNGRTIYGFTNQVAEEDLLRLAGRLNKAVKEDGGGRTMDLSHHFQSPSSSLQMSNPLLAIQKHPEGVSIKEKVSVVRQANDTARRLDPHVQQVRVLYRDVSQVLSIANSEGVLSKGERVGTVFSVQVVSAKENVVQTGYEAIGGAMGFELLDLHPPEEVANGATRRSLLMLSARTAPTGRMMVVLSNQAGGTMIHEAIGHGLEADLAQQGLSVYSKKIGEKVASSLITVVDDPTLPKMRGSYAFDDEGVAPQKTLLVEEGILKGYLYDRLTAFKEGVQSTGNGRRESYQHKPIPRMSNTLIVPGKTKPEEIIRSVEKGLFVKKMGGGQVNTVNGDFVFEVSEGYLIEKGSVGEPVRGAMLIGNGPQILKEIDRVGNDLGFGIGTCGKDGQGVPVSDGQPTLRIPEMGVGGQQEKI